MGYHAYGNRLKRKLSPSDITRLINRYTGEILLQPATYLGENTFNLHPQHLKNPAAAINGKFRSFN